MRVVSNTSPLSYLVLIKEIRILPELFTEIIIPPAVHLELVHPDAPAEVRDWISNPPPWLSVIDIQTFGQDRELRRLDPGETEAILLSEQLDADLLLLDDRRARRVARARGLSITGLIGVLDMGVEGGLVDPGTVVERLKTTNFRVSDKLLEILRVHSH